MNEYIEQGFDYLFSNYDPTFVVTAGTFIIHELSYFGYYLPYVIADRIDSLQKYKIQKVKEFLSNMNMDHLVFK